MKWAGPAAVSALVLVIFGAGIAILFAMGPTPPKVASGDKVLTLSDRRPTLVHGAAWVVCQADGGARLIADGRSPGALKVKLRQLRSLKEPGALLVGSRRLDAAISAKPQGWFDRFEFPVAGTDLSALSGVDTFGVFVADQTVAFAVTADAPQIAAFISACDSRRPSSLV